MGNNYTEDDYKKKCNELGLIYIGTHKEPHKGNMVDFICEKYKDKGLQSSDWGHFRVAKLGCPYCYGRKQTTEEIIAKIDNPDIEFLSSYTKCEEKMKCRCKVCGNVWLSRPHDLMRGRGCPICAKEKRRIARLKSKEQFVVDLKRVNPDIEVLGEYRGTHKKIKCMCNVCETTWEAYPANLLNKSAGCPVCNMSVGEKFLLDSLKAIGIDYISQYPIYDGKHKKPLRFDAYNQEYKIAFEYNGEQHYYPIDFAGKGEKWAEEEFNKALERDASKAEFCKSNGIQMIIVPYWERNNMESFIKFKMKEMNLDLVS